MAAHVELGGTALALGRTTSARRHFGLAELLRAPGDDRSAVPRSGMDLSIFARIWATHLTWYEGRPDRAHAQAEHALTLAARSAHPFTQTITLAYAAMLAQFRRDVAAVDRLAADAIAQATEHGFPYYRVWAELLRAWVLTHDGREEPLMEMRRCFDVLQEMAGLRLPYYRALLAEACARCGHTGEGLKEVSSAFDILERTDERWWEPELHRLRGELLAGAASANDREAETSSTGRSRSRETARRLAGASRYRQPRAAVAAQQGSGRRETRHRARLRHVHGGNWRCRPERSPGADRSCLAVRPACGSAAVSSPSISRSPAASSSSARPRPRRPRLGLLAAEPLRRGAQPPAHALGLRRRGLARALFGRRRARLYSLPMSSTCATSASSPRRCPRRSSRV